MAGSPGAGFPRLFVPGWTRSPPGPSEHARHDARVRLASGGAEDIDRWKARIELAVPWFALHGRFEPKNSASMSDTAQMPSSRQRPGLSFLFVDDHSDDSDRAAPRLPRRRRARAPGALEFLPRTIRRRQARWWRRPSRSTGGTHISGRSRRLAGIQRPGLPGGPDHGMSRCKASNRSSRTPPRQSNNHRGSGSDCCVVEQTL